MFLRENNIKNQQNSQLKVLVICNKSPWPPREGGPMAMNNLIEGLIDAGHKVKVLAFNTNKYTTNPEDIPLAYREKTGIELVYIDLSIKIIPALFNLFSTKSYHVERFISKDFEKQLVEVLQANEFDIVQIELLYMSPYLDTIRKHSKAKIVLRAHNIEHLIWERLEESEKNPLKKQYLKHLVKTLKRYEFNILDQYDGIVPITKKDAAFFAKNSEVPVMPVSFGIETEGSSPEDKQPVENALYHIGAMNWLPNEEGIKWFLTEVWPTVHGELPDLKLYLAGREMPVWLSRLDLKNVIVVGEVPDARDFIRSKAISIAPLLSGSGIRIKIIESMAMGKPVIATSIGAEGIEYTNGKNIMIANTPDDFSKAVKKLYENPVLRRQIGQNAEILIDNEHNTAKIIQRLVSFYRKIL